MQTPTKRLGVGEIDRNTDVVRGNTMHGRDRTMHGHQAGIPVWVPPWFTPDNWFGGHTYAGF